MKNRLEEFVYHHREEFDSEMPKQDLWPSIETRTEKKGGLLFRLSQMRKMAAVLLVLVNATALYFLVLKKDLREQPADKPATEQATSIPYEEEIDQISKLVEIKQASLKEISKTNPVLYSKFMTAMEQLNSSYRDLEKQLNVNPNKEPLLEAMIQNLGLQQELLNQQLSIYQKIKQSRNEKNTNSL
jgi:hypothetical protein